MHARSISSDAMKLRTTLWTKIMKAHASRAQFASAASRAALSEFSVTVFGNGARSHVHKQSINQSVNQSIINQSLFAQLMTATAMQNKAGTYGHYSETESTDHSSSSSFLACNSRLRSTIRLHHPPQRAVLSQICCFGERKTVMFQILLNGAEPCDAGTT